MFLSTTWAGNEDGRLVDSANEALAINGCETGGVMQILTGTGQDGKSLRSAP